MVAQLKGAEPLVTLPYCSLESRQMFVRRSNLLMTIAEGDYLGFGERGSWKENRGGQDRMAL